MLCRSGMLYKNQTHPPLCFLLLPIPCPLQSGFPATLLTSYPLNSLSPSRSVLGCPSRWLSPYPSGHSVELWLLLSIHLPVSSVGTRTVAALISGAGPDPSPHFRSFLYTLPQAAESQRRITVQHRPDFSVLETKKGTWPRATDTHQDPRSPDCCPDLGGGILVSSVPCSCI